MNFFRLTIIAIIVLFLSACNFTLAADITPPPGYRQPTAPEAPAETTSGPMYPLVPPDPAKGEAIFAEKCAPCHGATGLGDGPQSEQLPNPVIPIGTQEVARQAAPAYWYEMVTRGNLERFMPPFSSLTDRQRWDVVAFSYSLSSTPSQIAEGEALYQSNCSDCHGEAGKGDGPSSAGLSLPDFTNQEYMAGKSAVEFFERISDGTAGMPAFKDSISESERWALTDFLRSLSFNLSFTSEQIPATPQTTALPADQATPAGEMDTTEPVQPSEPEKPGIGTVGGFVMNASGGEVPSGLEVMLHGFDQMQVVMTATTTLLKDGSYHFSDVEMPMGRVFLTTIDFDGTTYGSDIATVESDEQEFQLPIQVYETTSDKSGLFADRLHMFFEQLDEGTVRVVELYILSNPGNQTIVATEPGDAVLEFSLPSDATNLEFQDDAIGGRYILTEQGFADTLPIRPGMGNYQVLFSYEMPFERNLELVHPVNVSTDALVILVPEDSVKIKGEGIQDAGVRDMQGAMYHMYNGGELEAGEQLSLTLSPRGMASANITSSYGLVIGVVAFGLVLIVAGIWLYRRSATVGLSDEDEDLELAASTPQSADAVMDAILALDDLYQEGQLPADAYHQRRAELKSQLSALMEDESA